MLTSFFKMNVWLKQGKLWSDPETFLDEHVEWLTFLGETPKEDNARGI